MRVLIDRRYHEPFDALIPGAWSDFWLYMVLGLLFLYLAAVLAKVKIRSFPVNPLYWHYWVIANAEKPPMTGSSVSPGNYRLYIYIWAASICSIMLALFILVSIALGGSQNG